MPKFFACGALLWGNYWGKSSKYDVDMPKKNCLRRAALGQLLGKILTIMCRILQIFACGAGQLLGNFEYLGNLLWATIREF